jgi:hypothetical protein
MARTEPVFLLARVRRALRPDLRQRLPRSADVTDEQLQRVLDAIEEISLEQLAEQIGRNGLIGDEDPHLMTDDELFQGMVKYLTDEQLVAIFG